jgi:hypothetical protein
MATQTLPFFKTGAALASAAAIAVASPAIAPNLTPTPNALSTAQVELTTISDLMSIPAYEWSNVLFGQDPYGGAISTGQASGLIIEPYASSCTGSDGTGVCTVGGIAGVTYLALDALINGNGAGFDNLNGILENPDEPYQPDPDQPNYNPYTTPPWSVSAVNYLYEPQYYIQLGNGSIFSFESISAGFSAASQYVLQATLGTAFPALSPVISALFYGPYLVTIAYTTALNAVADAVVNVPLVGPYVSDSILAYLGRLTSVSGAVYIEGLSGVLQLWSNWATGAEPLPTASTATTAASLAPAARATSPVNSVAAVTSTAADSAPSAVEASEVEASAVEASEVEAPRAGETGEDVTPVSSGSDEGTSTDPVSETTSVETPAETTSVVDSPSDVVTATTADAAPTATGPAEASTKVGKRSARGAAARVATKVASAIGAVKAGVAKAGAAQSANGR